MLAYMHICHGISRCAYMLTYMDAYMQLRQRICIYAPICVCTYAYLPAHTHKCLQICLRICIPARISIYAYMPTYMHAHMQLCHRICIYAPIPACIYANMPGYKHICIYGRRWQRKRTLERPVEAVAAQVNWRVSKVSWRDIQNQRVLAAVMANRNDAEIDKRIELVTKQSEKHIAKEKQMVAMMVTMLSLQ